MSAPDSDTAPAGVTRAQDATRAQDDDDEADDAPAPPKKPVRWWLALVGIALGVGAIAGLRKIQEIREQPGKGVKLASKASPTRRPWLDEGYVEMVPPLRMPSRVNGESRIEVWLKVPAGQKIGVKRLEEQKRWTLVYPKGTIVDRLEMPDGEHIADVRGTEIGQDGGEYFHVYRPFRGQMRGFVWRGDDAAQQEEATRVLLEHVRLEEKVAPKELELTRINNACAPCHAHERPIAIKAVRNQPNRGTDGGGFFQPETVLSDRAVIEQHRPREMNVDDPYIKFHCFGDGSSDSEPVWTQRQNGTKWPTCSDQTNPIGVVDVPAGLAASDIHVKRLCTSRKALYDLMNDEARKAFADAFAACKVGG